MHVREVMTIVQQNLMLTFFSLPEQVLETVLNARVGDKRILERRHTWLEQR